MKFEEKISDDFKNASFWADCTDELRVIFGDSLEQAKILLGKVEENPFLKQDIEVTKDLAKKRFEEICSSFVEKFVLELDSELYVQFKNGYMAVIKSPYLSTISPYEA